MKNIILSILVTFLAVTIGISQNDSTYIIGKSFVIESNALEGEVSYHINLPYGYEETKKSYPVLFVMNSHLPSTYAGAVATISKLSYKRIPDMILVGISNTGVAGNYWACPNDSGKVESAEKFYSFLEKELIPTIQKKYRTNGFKILMGQSNTGLYVSYNLLIHPELFDAYIVSSPMFGWCSEYYQGLTKSLLQSTGAVNKKLYISYGDMDFTQVLDHINNYKNILEQYAPENFYWELEEFNNTGHVPLFTLNNALLYFFSEYTLPSKKEGYSIQEIESRFKKLSNEYGFKLIPKSSVLFDLAFDLNDENKLDESIEMFDYLISLYPNSAFNYYGKGIVYYRNEKMDLAKQCFLKSLEIDPDFTRSKNFLERLSNK